MFSSVKNKSARRHGGIFPVSSLLFFLIALLFLMPVRAESRTTLNENLITSENPITSSDPTDPDTTKPKYDINDPRNPDCPCHKAQQQANEEYQNSQNGNQPLVNNNPHANNTDNNVDNNDVDNNNNKNINAQVQHNPVQSSTPTTEVNTQKTTFSGGSGGSQKHYSSMYKFQKKTIRWMKKVNRKLTKRHHGVKKGKFHVADCFHFA